MSKEHEIYSKENPEAYEGKIIRPGTPQGSPAEGQTCSIIEAANYLDIPRILVRFGDWVICQDGGLYSLYVQYHIAKGRLSEDDWIDHVTQKPWVNPDDFIIALKTTKEMVANGKI